MPLDKTTATKIIETARFYMSGDNCQPYRYRFNIDAQTFYIDYLAEQAKHTFVYDDYTLLMTLGSLLEYLEISLLQYDYDIALSFSLENFSAYQDQKGICAVAVKPGTTQSSKASLFSALKSRFTDRRPYLGPDTIDIDTKTLNTHLSYSQCSLFKDAKPHALTFFSRCDSAIWLSKPLGKDIMDAVAFDPKSTKGLPWRNLGVKKVDAFLIRAIQRHGWLFTVAKYCGARWMMLQTQKKLWFSSRSALVFTFSPNLNFEQKTLASKEMMQVMLALSKQGYVFQPSTMSAEILNTPLKSKNIVTASNMQPSSLNQEIPAMRDYLGIKENEVQWVLRIGKVAQPLDPEALTKRHAVNHLLTFE